MPTSSTCRNSATSRRSRCPTHSSPSKGKSLWPLRRGLRPKRQPKIPTVKPGADMADAHAKPQHDYHIIDPSPWPFLGAVGALVMAVGGVAWMQYLKAGEFPLF